MSVRPLLDRQHRDAFMRGVDPDTLKRWTEAGLLGEPGSLLDDLMLAYNLSSDRTLLEHLMAAARKAKELSPFAACRQDLT